MSENYTPHPGHHVSWQDQHCAFRVPILASGVANCRHSPPVPFQNTNHTRYPEVTNKTPACSFWLHWKDGPDQ